MVVTVTGSSPRARRLSGIRLPPKRNLRHLPVKQLLEDGLQKLHEDLIVRQEVDVTTLPKRPDGSSRVLAATFFKCLLEDRFESKLWKGTEVSAAQLDLGQLTLEQLLTIRIRLGSSAECRSNGALSEFFGILNRRFFEKLAKHVLRESSPAQAALNKAVNMFDFGVRSTLVIGVCHRVAGGKFTTSSDACQGDTEKVKRKLSNDTESDLFRSTTPPAWWALRVGEDEWPDICGIVFDANELRAQALPRADRQVLHEAISKSAAAVVAAGTPLGKLSERSPVTFSAACGSVQEESPVNWDFSLWEEPVAELLVTEMLRSNSRRSSIRSRCRSSVTSGADELMTALAARRGSDLERSALSAPAVVAGNRSKAKRNSQEHQESRGVVSGLVARVVNLWRRSGRDDPEVALRAQRAQAERAARKEKCVAKQQAQRSPRHSSTKIDENGTTIKSSDAPSSTSEVSDSWVSEDHDASLPSELDTEVEDEDTRFHQKTVETGDSEERVARRGCRGKGRTAKKEGGGCFFCFRWCR
eukprot:TRINITY_DN17207_c0_g5_i1.p1 TRINITY_DN17207_c0_g5~~TRINITY_DN17207_c0_g5_i1.p1  ORF type:complete len:529 (+),score=113.72 TRINITY_DN17207_c0_g5_i1:68-1654(+)